MPSNLNSYAKINETVSAQSREVNPFLNDIPIELISYEDSNNLLTSLNITTGLGNTDKRRTLAKALGFSSGVMLALGASGSRRSTNPVYKKVALSGSWTFAANNASINGTGGKLLTDDELRLNEVVFTSAGLASQVQSVNSDNQFVLYVPFEVSGTSVTLYRLIPVSDYIGQIELLTIGYLHCELSYTGDILTYSATVNVGNYTLSIPSNTLTVTGAAGWRYIVVSPLGVVSVETIPVAEITADTQVYTPTPVFNSSANGYYSTVNTARRIVGICYFDTTIKEVIAYGSGKNKRDGYLYGYSGVSPFVNVLNDRLQYTGTIFKSRGDITLVDNGAGNTPVNAMRITNNVTQPINIFGSVGLVVPIGGAIVVALQKNGSETVFYDIVQCSNVGGTAQINQVFNFNYTDNYSSSNDFYQIYISATLGLAGAQIYSIGANHVSV